MNPGAMTSPVQSIILVSAGDGSIDWTETAEIFDPSMKMLPVKAAVPEPSMIEPLRSKNFSMYSVLSTGFSLPFYQAKACTQN